MINEVIEHFHYANMQYTECGSTSTVLMFILYWTEQNDRKLHVFATKHKANTYSKHLIHSHEDVSI